MSDDVRELIGDEPLEAAELERLQRLHAVLTQIGPPPELAPTLEHAPEPPVARVIPFPRRYRYTAVAAAVAAALALFGIGYLVGASPADPERTVVMRGSSGAVAELDLFDKDTAGNWPMELRVRGLASGRYELWLTRRGELADSCGVFAVNGETTVPLNAPFRLSEYDGWVVVPAGSERAVLTT